MTTQIPTSNLPDPSASAGLPDLAALTALANGFFAALPGVVPGLGAPPDHPLALGSAVPAIVPTAAPVSTPDPQTLTSSEFGRGASPVALGVPQAYAAALPQAASAPIPGSASPYYFGAEASRADEINPGEIHQYGYGGLAAAAVGSANQGDRVSAQPYALPGADALGQLLAQLQPEPRHASAPQQATSGQFYFLDHALPGQTTPRLEARPQAEAQPKPNTAFDVQAVRRDFPILAERVNGKQLIWLDNAATTQKPQVVIDRLSYFYQHENSNIHRAAHELAARATDAYEGARSKVARFIGARSVDEIVFVRGATEAINLVANTFGRQHIGEGDEIIVSHLEHHANIVPWQQLAASVGARIKVIPVDDTGQILLSEYAKLLCSRTRLVAVTQVSNALGTVTPVHEIVQMAHAVGARVLIDGAQSVSHMRVNMQALDADFFVFSGHKVFGPTGIGVVYGKQALLDSLPPWQGGGNMIADVTFDRTVYQKAPSRFEAGTGNIADAVGLGAALDYLERVGLDNVARYEHDLLVYATHHLQRIPGLRIIGTAAEKASVVSFVLDGYRTEEVGAALNREGVAVRSGHHCAQPILRRFGLEATVRPSLAFYNTCEEVDVLVAVVNRLARAK